MDYSQYIWNYLEEKIGNEYGVAGLMGNLQAESNLQPNNMQNSYEDGLGFNDESYTTAVDNRSYPEESFVNDKVGYGLAQWTHYSRKQMLYDRMETYNTSIGDIDLQLDFLYWELENSYPTVLATLKKANSIVVASNAVLFDFENPADQSSRVQSYRTSLGQSWYNKYADAGTTVNPPTTPDPPVSGSVYELIYATPYKLGQLTNDNVILLQSLNLLDRVQMSHTFNRNKRQIGTNMFGKRLTQDNKEYTIIGVGRNGFLRIARNEQTAIYYEINPKYVKGVGTI